MKLTELNSANFVKVPPPDGNLTRYKKKRFIALVSNPIIQNNDPSSVRCYLRTGLGKCRANRKGLTL